MVNLLIFIHKGGIWKVLHSPIILATKVSQKGTKSVYSHPLPSDKIAPWQPS